MALGKHTLIGSSSSYCCFWEEHANQFGIAAALIAYELIEQSSMLSPNDAFAYSRYQEWEDSFPYLSRSDVKRGLKRLNDAGFFEDLRDHIIEKQNERKNYAPTPKPGHVYVIDWGDGRFKIGLTTKGIAARMRELEQVHDRALALTKAYSVNDTRKAEKAAHLAADAVRVPGRGEFFMLEPEHFEAIDEALKGLVTG